MARTKKGPSGPPSPRNVTSLAHLVVSPERAAWILERYPPNETGRPMILATEYHARSRTRRAAAGVETLQAGEHECEEPETESVAAD
jgi:hypothetical protein